MSEQHIENEADTATATVHDANRELFRSHARARLSGDAAETARLATEIGEGRRMAHLLYVLYLFAQTVLDEYGDTPDPSDLAELTARLHHRHGQPGNGFRAIRAEAMVRAICGDSLLLTEVPVAEQPTYMWAVITDLADPEGTDAEVTERLHRAEALGAEILRGGMNSLFTDTPATRPGPEATPVPEQGAETEPPDTEAAATGNEEATA